MIDSNYQVYLIEVNSNPCLETNCPVLNKIIPDFIEHTLQYFCFYVESAWTQCSLLLWGSGQSIQSTVKTCTS